jgi:hypothetical protein
MGVGLLLKFEIYSPLADAKTNSRLTHPQSEKQGGFAQAALVFDVQKGGSQIRC